MKNLLSLGCGKELSKAGEGGGGDGCCAVRIAKVLSAMRSRKCARRVFNGVREVALWGVIASAGAAFWSLEPRVPYIQATIGVLRLRGRETASRPLPSG